MEIILFGNTVYGRFNKFNNANYAIKLDQTNEVWLFNCIENTQHIFVKHQLKLNQITKIFIASTSFEYIAGLPGLLSSLTLSGKINAVSIYGPTSLKQHLQACTKYSQTNFSFPLNFYTARYGKLVSEQSYTVIGLPLYVINENCGFTILKKERQGVFNRVKANSLNIPQGPIYGYLKQEINFISPDGYYLSGKDFSSNTTLGPKISIAMFTRYSRIVSEMYWLCSCNIIINICLHQQVKKHLPNDILTNIMNYQIYQDNCLIE